MLSPRAPLFLQSLPSPRVLIMRLRGWFPEREIIMRTEGRVRFLRISTRAQMLVAGGVLAVVIAWLLTLAGICIAHLLAAHHTAALASREAQIIRAEARVAAYRRGLAGVADDLLRRQEVIERVVEAHVGDLPRDTGANTGTAPQATPSAAHPAVAPKKISALTPEAAPLARAEARQLAFVAALTRYAEARAARDGARLQRLGLNPAAMLAANTRGASASSANEGGPFEPLTTSADGTLDPRFAQLGASLARMDALAHTIDRLPQVLPARFDTMTSGFGYRADPFTHAGAFHPGLDFRGAIGAPIYAAARGVVRFAGRKAGYGNCLEIDHGKGLVTRYAHMSAFRAHVGETVAAGALIGAIGSTGRSTGPHLHFEVRIDDHPVNPRPFLEAIPHVSQIPLAHQAAGSPALQPGDD